MTKEMNEVPVPAELKERQVTLAKAYVKDKHELGLGVTDFCSKYSVSTATWYKWLDNPKFERYINELQGNIISDSEKEAYHIVKKKIMQMATKKDASVKEIELFNQHFSYVIESEKREAMQKLGITPEGEKGNDTRTLAEKKNVLLSRLKGDA
ncbi:hypothetical protein CHI12_16650 [Terribacillus saccharophilus]|uniref:Homeodomain phBC6A51-type domain-containing protein n=1 Tax=Terribacillus saccharophilus TaxID=361277 RepID=A0A268H971_9BACI|nr:phBC6A51 family helix-turn-helix protein [Terribacillus saccharophilus]PAE06404.1 hypothetical protein CHI12_16650 [Terribacillus saccharophilus]